MRIIRAALVCALAAAATSAHASDSAATPTTLDRIYDFLAKNVDGRKVKIAHIADTIPGTDIRTDFDRKTFYSTLERTAFGLRITMTYVVEQTNYVPQADGSTRTESKDRVVANTCEFHTSQAQNAPDALFGFCATPVSSYAAPTTVMSAKLELQGDKLVMASATVGFSDCFANNATGYEMCRSEGTRTFSLVNGKLHAEQLLHSFTVTDANTLAGTPRGGDDWYIDDEF